MVCIKRKKKRKLKKKRAQWIRDFGIRLKWYLKLLEKYKLFKKVVRTMCSYLKHILFTMVKKKKKIFKRRVPVKVTEKTMAKLFYDCAI